MSADGAYFQQFQKTRHMANVFAHCWIMAITSSLLTASSHKKVRILWFGFLPLAEYQGPKAKSRFLAKS
jgi:hypothetical protein